MSKELQTKNVRLTFEAWSELRKLKFDKGMSTYSDVFKLLFNTIEGGPNLVELIQTKIPSDEGNKRDTNDKTIVITDDIHVKLAHYKIQYMRKSGATARGPGSVSISDVVKTLISEYRKKN
ncbi:MAG: hypothetical protein OEY49_13475 [Candidatus Heimdallarchaeota archaeon]|nr:hypothetical protein [Candidatus Heimdallarchaeota archaeon]